ncbi:60S ribosomal protein L21 (nucleomorph) [Chroomonas mesostigmatica CCMP1168]|uniref:60S ribosomal protein L21 n=1 Tax=Chroomonas mesostigmatica CCMP1168 TaxID=1195612 RepID=J7G627_9CRYP|nr:60S ribosomal protein L21 [Chroomonas mesostigmatica CCMP1168]|mmetsp:Transcript_66754/g.164506  ORF Transcript_66754/g.164506 Transcript_66754/m.164506 type:complete len:160 (+) Transcript_66754:81-560(+)
MTRSGGKRSNTRNIFSRSFRKHGPQNTSTHLRTFKKGDLVDIKGNSSVHKGLPFKFYHGKTGKIFNITKGSLGLKIYKTVGNRKILKKINVRIEHVQKSKSKVEFSEKIRSKDFVRRFEKQNEKIVFSFPKKSLTCNEEHTVSFRKIMPLDPEPFCVTI